MDGLRRFRDAQAQVDVGWDAAMTQLRAGRKRGHWIWYVFPQLAGLGQSAMSQHFGIEGQEEAAAYLADDQLRTRLEAAVAVVVGHVGKPDPIHLDVLMGSRVDATKLVSSLTLFEAVGRVLLHEGDTRAAHVVEQAGVVLAVASEQGYPPCAYTREALAGRAGRHR